MFLDALGADKAHLLDELGVKLCAMEWLLLQKAGLEKGRRAQSTCNLLSWCGAEFNSFLLA